MTFSPATADKRLGASFRDPSGFVFRQGDLILRQVNASYEEALTLLNSSGLYRDLTSEGLLIPHTEVGLEFAQSDEAIAVLKPETISTISYPYEWCFSQLKDAALTTLKIQRLAVEHGMTLKDASAYNIQFHHGRPVLIDSLSFEPYEAGKPWIAYRQFCQHFIAPLVLMSHVDVRLSRLAASYIDGIPLDLASTISKPRSRLNARIAMHLHLHAKFQSDKGGSELRKDSRGQFGKNALLGLVDSLNSLVESLDWKPEGTEWADYYSDTNYSPGAMSKKQQLVGEFLGAISPTPQSVWDLGANNGEFSAISTSLGFNTIAWDIDPAAVEKNYLARRSDRLMLPLVQDLTNPSPAIGWALKERDSFIERGPAGALMALALVHHLAIGNNVPLSEVASFFARIGEWLIIEFVPKDDSQVQRLLATREDVFPTYTQPGFETSFGDRFDIVRSESILGTVRTLYLMRRRSDAC
jgi:hypothetical protein